MKLINVKLTLFMPKEVSWSYEAIFPEGPFHLKIIDMSVIKTFTMLQILNIISFLNICVAFMHFSAKCILVLNY